LERLAHCAMRHVMPQCALRMRWTRLSVLVMRVLLLLCCLVSGPALAGLWTPPVFTPIRHADGAVTWTFTMDVKDIPKEHRSMPEKQRNELYAGASIARTDLCPKGWELTSSRTENKRLILEGRCL
jgi:hypothetical protein